MLLSTSVKKGYSHANEHPVLPLIYITWLEIPKNLRKTTFMLL